jgi:hypothetical protein
MPNPAAELSDLAFRLRLVRRMERYFLKQWAVERMHSSPKTLDRVAADLRQSCENTDSASAELDLMMLFENVES